VSSSDRVVQAWKDLDVREAIGMPAHPAGEIELDANPLVGGTGTACITAATAITMALSCAPTCEQTFGHGTCDYFSYGCC
jgi:mersacidin/lichenicidin family type 2 lantibiotic